MIITNSLTKILLQVVKVGRYEFRVSRVIGMRIYIWGRWE